MASSLNGHYGRVIPGHKMRASRVAGLAMAALGCGLAIVAIAPARATAVRAAGAPVPRESSGDPARIFLSDCATCHGADATGTAQGPALIGIGPAAIDYWVTTGRMPLDDPGDAPRRRQSPYDSRTQHALVAYVSALTGPGPGVAPAAFAPASRARGGELYRLQCAACHQWAGEGGALLHREAPSLHAASARQIAEAVRVGPGSMPAFGSSALTDDDLASVVAYVRYLRDPHDRGGEPLWHLGPLAEGSIAFVFGLGLLVIATRWIGDKA